MWLCLSPVFIRLVEKDFGNLENKEEVYSQAKEAGQRAAINSDAEVQERGKNLLEIIEKKEQSR